MSYEKQNFIDGQVLKAEHLNKMEKELARKKNWAELEGKPTAQESIGDTLTWDGNTEGLVIVELSGAAFAKVSGTAPSMADFANGYTVNSNQRSNVGGTILEVTSDLIADDGMWFAVALSDTEFEGTALTKGLYLAFGGEYVSSLTIPGYTFTKEVIDPDHIPQHTHDVSWNELTDKPFGDGYGDTLTWEAITDDTFDESKFVGGFCYLISDAVVTMSDLQNGFTMVIAEGQTETISAAEITEFADGFVLAPEGLAMFVDENAVGVDFEGLVFPQKGVYTHVDLMNVSCTLTIPGYAGFITPYPIDKKYLPNIPAGKLPAEAFSAPYILTCDDTYLYYNGEKITKTQLKEFVNSGNALYLKKDVELCVPHQIGQDFDRIVILDIVQSFMGPNDTDNYVKLNAVVYWTAEYTP